VPNSPYPLQMAA